MTVSIAAWMLPREARVPSVRSRSRSSRRLLRFIRSVRSSSSSTKPVMPPSGPRTGATRTCNSCSPRTVVATCERGGGIVLDAVQGVREQVAIDDAENRTAQADGRVVAQHRPRGGVVEQDLPVDVAHDDRRGEFGHQRGQPVPLLRRGSPARRESARRPPVRRPCAARPGRPPRWPAPRVRRVPTGPAGVRGWRRASSRVSAVSRRAVMV